MYSLILTAGGCVGLLLMILGLRGHRVGDEPRCRKCRYNLMGIDLRMCPECGRQLGDLGILYGRRVWRPRLTAVGSCFFLLALCIMVPATYCRMHGINAWTRAPFWLVFHAARADEANASAELMRRCVRRQLKGSDADRLAHEALDCQNAPGVDPSRQRWVDLLQQMDYAGLLNLEQRQRFYRQCAQLMLGVRSGIREGDPITIALHRTGRTPSYGALPVVVQIINREPWALPSRQQLLEMLIRSPDDTSYRRYLEQEIPMTIGAPGSGAPSATVVLPPLPAGPHTITFKLRVQYAPSEMMMAWEESISRVIDVLPASSPLDAVPVDDSRLAQDMAACVSVSSVTVKPVPRFDRGSAEATGAQIGPNVPAAGNPSWPALVSLRIHGELPAPISFDCYLVTHTGEYRVSALDGCYFGICNTERIGHATVPPVEEQGAYIELRPNPIHLLGTIDQRRYWSNTIRIGPLRIKNLPADVREFRDWTPPSDNGRSKMPRGDRGGAILPG